ncbi:hypothetical protein EDB81DRAFT_900666 [Dactylonectria macrodidyma]|uniref:NmrA-like domain-containing protein n=1 Tax=Dactylonectria macrodidyma TaxID=307937 RepID=A0A9P9J0Q9_9HYPO|nr:hypothetical protein EDB81DRAFT_900666 [Dactylonectria macrodidyma]
MVNVAIAGGTGVMGKTLADVLARQTAHQGLILTRKEPGTTKLPLPQFVVDYNDVASLTSFLEQHEVHAVISAFGINGTSLAVSQMNLIKASEASSVTKRFIPSSFAIDYPRDEKTNLEWAVVNNGTFLDYYAPPTLESHYQHGTVVLDIPNAAAGIPGTGDEPQTFTYTFDVARFTIAALDLPSWPRELRIVGDTLTYNEFVKLAEAARGVKFDVKYDDLQKLRRFEITELPGHSDDYKKFPKHALLPFLSIFQRWMAEGHGLVPKEGSLNELFPEIETLTATKLMDQYWRT